MTPSADTARPLSRASQKALLAISGLGAAAFLAALRLDAPRAWANLLLGNVYFLSISAVAAVFIAVQYLSKAGWPTLFRRIPEALCGYLPAGAATAGLLCLGVEDLYHWAHPGEHDAVLAAKHAFLNVPFFRVRTILYVLLWLVFARALVRRSRAQDEDGNPAHTAANVALSAAFLAVFAATFSLASIDWIMSLEPHWYSALFPWYVFSGAFVHAVAAVTLLLILLRRRGFFPEANRHHFHDLGKYLFAFSVFWGYLWFSQYLLIWYSNIPEETAYFVTRSGAWNGVFWLNPAINLLLPFILLLSASAKKSPSRLLAACGVLFLGRWLDLYLMIMPPLLRHGPRLGWQEVLVFLGLGALFVLIFDRAFASAPPVPAKDPYLAESLHHHAS